MVWLIFLSTHFFIYFLLLFFLHFTKNPQTVKPNSRVSKNFTETFKESNDNSISLFQTQIATKKLLLNEEKCCRDTLKGNENEENYRSHFSHSLIVWLHSQNMSIFKLDFIFVFFSFFFRPGKSFRCHFWFNTSFHW